MRHDVIGHFRTAMLEASLIYRGEIITDGKLHRFYVEGDRRGTHNGWYVLHLDGVPVGSFGSWKTGETRTWCARETHRFTEAERAEYQRRLEETKRQRQEATARDHDSTREKASAIWRLSQPVELHPYLSRKGVKAFGIRQHQGCLVIPLRDTQGAIHSLQFIGAEGNKRFLKGGAISGHYHPIGQHSGTLCIAEGYATAATIHQATRHAVAVAFNAGNLRSVALALRGKFPDAKIILCADNDRFTPGNPGVTKAREAAIAVGGYLTVPRFDDSGPFDFYKEGRTDG
jgi:putative DNA primase/helicase